MDPKLSTTAHKLVYKEVFEKRFVSKKKKKKNTQNEKY